MHLDAGSNHTAARRGRLELAMKTGAAAELDAAIPANHILNVGGNGSEE